MNNKIKSLKRPASASADKTTADRSGKKSCATFKTTWHYIWMFRAVIISVPVLVASICQAFRNASRLPETVGLNIQANGEFAMTMARPAAVLLPLLITIGSIILTCCTKRPLFPWLISIFTLVLPVLIWIINIYPA